MSTWPCGTSTVVADVGALLGEASLPPPCLNRQCKHATRVRAEVVPYVLLVWSPTQGEALSGKRVRQVCGFQFSAGGGKGGLLRGAPSGRDGISKRPRVRGERGVERVCSVAWLVVTAGSNGLESKYVKRMHEEVSRFFCFVVGVLRACTSVGCVKCRRALRSVFFCNRYCLQTAWFW